jgi:hypothetical protein
MWPSFSGACKAGLTTAAMAVALLALALGNEHLLRFTEVAAGVNWIYLPAGMRMCYVLVLPIHGALAIFTASVLMTFRDPTLGWTLVMVSGCVTAAGPVLARAVALQRLGLQTNLENLTSVMLWKLAALFGLFSTALHQAFYLSIGRESAFALMWVGDTLGCLICLYGLKGLAAAWRQGRQP